MKKVCMLGSGAWGTAVASVLAYNGYQVNLWCHESDVAKMIETKHCNERYLPDANLSKRIVPFIDMKKALEGVQWVFEAIPVKFLRAVLEKAKPYYKDHQRWVILSKGIENEKLLLSSQILDDVFKTNVKKVVVSGPSFAKEVAAQQVTAVDMACVDEKLALELYKVLTNNYFRANVIDDILGVQIGGALKNIVAIATGMLYGAGYADNTKALMLTSCLHEMVDFATFLGVHKETICGLSGFGDLSLTCMGALSRNLMIGKKLGAGQTLEGILAQTHAVPEGVNTVKSVYAMIQQCKLGNPEFKMVKANPDAARSGYKLHMKCKEEVLQMPLFEAIYEVVFENKTIQDLIDVLKR